MNKDKFIDAMLSLEGIIAAKRLLDEAPCLSETLSTEFYVDYIKMTVPPEWLKDGR